MLISWFIFIVFEESYFFEIHQKASDKNFLEWGDMVIFSHVIKVLRDGKWEPKLTL